MKKEATLQASADPGVIKRALEKKPALKEQFQDDAGKAGKAEKAEKEVKDIPVQVPAPEQAVPTQEIDEEESKEVAPEVISIAGYGPKPEKWWGSISYFINVLLRKRNLKAEIKKIGDDCIKKKNDRDSELLVLGHLKMKSDDVKTKYPQQVEAIAQAKTTLEAAGKEKTSEEQDIEDKENYLNEEISRLESEINHCTDEQKYLKGERKQRNTQYAQARARVQKYDVEIENLNKLIQERSRTQTPQDLAVVEKYNFQIKEIESKRAVDDQNMRQAQTRMEEIDGKLSLVSVRLKEATEKVDDARNRKSQVLASLKERSTAVAIKFHKQHNEYNKCLRELAITCFENDDIPREFEDRKDRLREKIAIAEQADLMLEQHFIALDSYDRFTYKRGMILLSVGGGIFTVLTILFAIAMYYAFTSIFT